jgi:cytoskeleton protein RodZ
MAKVTRLSFEQGDSLERKRLHLREISADADTPLDTVGQDLRTARQRKGEDLASVSCHLKIRKDYLDALEESQFDILPGRTYAIGFIRSYSQYLGLDPRASVERYKAEIEGLGEIDADPATLQPEPERKLPQGTLVIGILLLIGVAYGGYYLSVSADRMLAEPEAAVPERLTAAPPPAPPPAPAPIAPPAPTVAPAVPVIAEAPVQTPAEALAAAAAALPAGRAYGTQNVGSRITVRFHAAARILVQGADERLFINRTLEPGDIYHAPNVAGMTLTTPDAGALELILDGASLGFVGEKGTLIEALSLNPQDIVHRAQQTAG